MGKLAALFPLDPQPSRNGSATVSTESQTPYVPAQKGEDLDFPNDVELPPAIPAGDDYEVAFIRVERAWFFRKEKVYLYFRITQPGPWYGTVLYMACTIPPRGRWTVSCKYWCMWVLASGRRPARNDRLNTNVFRGKIFKARVRTVTKRSKAGIARTGAMQYSVIDELLEVIAGPR